MILGHISKRIRYIQNLNIYKQRTHRSIYQHNSLNIKRYTPKENEYKSLYMTEYAKEDPIKQSGQMISQMKNQIADIPIIKENKLNSDIDDTSDIEHKELSEVAQEIIGTFLRPCPHRKQNEDLYKLWVDIGRNRRGDSAKMIIRKIESSFKGLDYEGALYYSQKFLNFQTTTHFPIEEDVPVGDHVLHTYYYPPVHIEGVQTGDQQDQLSAVILLQGYGEYAGKYEYIASELSQNGFGTYTFDMQGCGRSIGTRGDLHNLLSDTKSYIRHLISQNPELRDIPVFVMGHSLGALLGLWLAQERVLENLSGLVLSAPLLHTPDLKEVTDGTNLIKEKLLRIRYNLNFSSSSIFAPELITNNQERIKKYYADEYIYHRPILKESVEIIKSIQEEVMENMNKINIPALIIQGGSDNVVDHNLVYNKCCPMDRNRASRDYILIEDCGHDILFDEEYIAMFMQDIPLWIFTHLSK